MFHGSCLCGGIRFEVERIATMAHYRWSMCRKAHGAAFAPLASAASTDFRFVRGEDLVVRCESSPGSYRAFCGACGSHAPTFLADGASVYIPAGLLDGDPATRPTLHMYVGSRAPGWVSDDALSKCVEWPVDEPM